MQVFSRSVAPARRTASWCLVVILLLAPGACADEENDSGLPVTPTDSSGNPVNNNGISTTTVPFGRHDNDLGLLRHSASWVDETRDGYRTEGSIHYGEPVSPTKMPPTFRAAAPACDVDDDVDVVIPAVVSLRNATMNFNQQLEGQAQPEVLDWPGRPAVLIELGGQVQCKRAGDHQDNVSWQSAGKVAYGQSVDTKMYFVVHGYYSPKAASGNDEMLSYARVQLSATGVATVKGDGALNDPRFHGVRLSGR